MRELRQHASVYLAQVAAGKTLQVTDRGRPVAMLVPIGGDRWDDLVRRGHIQVPEGDGDVADEPAADYGVDATAALLSYRADER